MAFLYPAFLFALAAVAVPIAIHLFNLRRFKKVYFSDVRFLREVQIQTRSRNRLRHLLVLLARCLAIIFLVMAFARPVIPHGDLAASEVNAAPTLYIDNSFSMDAAGEEGALIETAKARALSVTDAFGQSRNIAVLTNEFAGAEGRPLSLADARQSISEINISPRSRSVAEVLRRLDASSGAGDAKELYIISDLQKHQFEQISVSDTDLTINIIPLQSVVQNNLMVDSVWLTGPVRLPGQYDEAKARIRNVGNQKVVGISVRLSVNGDQKALATVDVEAQSFEDVTLGYTPERAGPHFLDVTIMDHPITFDDSYHLSFTIAQKLKVLDIQGPGSVRAFGDLFGGDPLFQYTVMRSGAIDLAAVTDQDLVVLNGIAEPSSGLLKECALHMQNGGSVVWAPDAVKAVESTNIVAAALGSEAVSTADTGKFLVKELAMNSIIFKGVFTQVKDRIDLPSSKKLMRPVTNSATVREDIMRSGAGEPFLSSYAIGTGKLYTLFAPLTDGVSNFTRHALFVPVFYNVAAYSRMVPYSALRTNSDEGTPVRIAQGTSRESIKVVSIVDGSAVAPEVQNSPTGFRLMLHGEVRTAGHYLVVAGQDTLGTISLNYPKMEGVTEYLSADEAVEALHLAGIARVNVMDEVSDRLALAIEERHHGTQLWRLMLILALLMLALETILIRTA